MKFTCEAQLLKKAVNTTARAAAPKSPNDALEGLLIEATENVKFSGYDMKKGIYTSIDANVTSAGSIVIPARLLSSIASKLPDGIVTFSCDDNLNFNIVCGETNFKEKGLDPDDYPELPSLDSNSCLVMKPADLASMISETSFAVSKNEARPVYTGELFEVDGDVLTAVAIDGFRLAVRKEKFVSCDSRIDRFIVPGNALGDVENICAEDEEDIRIYVGETHISFTVGKTVLFTRRLEGDFLKYEKTIPAKSEYHIHVKKSDMISCVERVSLIINDRIRSPLHCKFGDKVFEVSCTTPTGQAEDCCFIEGNGNNLMVGFNHQYLLDALRKAPTDQVCLQLNTANTPCIITDTEESDKFLYMVLPVRLAANN